MGSTTALTPERIGEKASDATDRTPEVTTPRPPLASRVMMEIMAQSPRRVVRAPRIMGEAYRIILAALVARGFAPPRAPIRLPRAKLLLIVLRNLV